MPRFPVTRIPYECRDRQSTDTEIDLVSQSQLLTSTDYRHDLMLHKNLATFILAVRHTRFPTQRTAAWNNRAFKPCGRNGSPIEREKCRLLSATSDLLLTDLVPPA